MQALQPSSKSETRISITDAKRQFEEVVQAALDGKKIVITRYGLPVVQLGKLAPQKAKRIPAVTVNPLSPNIPRSLAKQAG